MFSQEDLETYNRVQNAMQMQRQLETQDRQRSRLARILATIFIVLFLGAAGGAGFLGYNVYWLNQNYLGLQSRYAEAVSDYNGVVNDYKASIQSKQALAETLSQSNHKVQTLNHQLDTERKERNSAVSELNENVESLVQQITEERASALREITTRNERIAGFIQVNAELEESVTGLESSVNRLESTNRSLSEENSSLTQRNNTLTREKSSLTQRNNELNLEYNALARENSSMESENRRLSGRVSSLQSQLVQARAQQVTIPTCSSNYFTVTAGKLSCVDRNSNSFQATQVETRTVDLPHSGSVNLRINRSGELGSDRSMDLLEYAVKTIEGYMGRPIPLKGNEIRLDFLDEKIFQCGTRAAGCYLGTHIEIREKLDSDARPRGDDQLASTIAHEVSHYYFSGERDWLDEGAAEFLANYSESQRTGQKIKAQQHRPCLVANIRSLEQRRHNNEDEDFVCNYSLGEGLFLELYENLSEEDFQRAFRRIIASSDNKIAGIYQVRQAFYPSAEWVQKIIDKWYGYREKPEAHWNNGTFLGYMTWKEASGWTLQVNRDNEPCATILRLDDHTTGAGYSVRETRDACHYTGRWNEYDDLIVTVSGKEYRAVKVEISGQPQRYNYSMSPSI